MESFATKVNVLNLSVLDIWEGPGYALVLNGITRKLCINYVKVRYRNYSFFIFLGILFLGEISNFTMEMGTSFLSFFSDAIL